MLLMVEAVFAANTTTAAAVEQTGRMIVGEGGGARRWRGRGRCHRRGRLDRQRWMMMMLMSMSMRRAPQRTAAAVEHRRLG